ncbi:transposase [Candidatus Protofrankia californiensis]|uniref:Transposase n=1 Tax=Candidatus Protofrankia californiensis TaxID=1839754 RepID=A0A1C3NZK6_9ACTN|nr:transposase [Candidatus Protofrankia californiensis]
MLAVRWYLRYALSYRDIEELLAERGLLVYHVTVYRWVQRFTPLLIDTARPCLHSPGDRWFVDETYVQVSGRWIYLYRAVDQDGQVIDVFASDQRYLAAARRFFTRALSHGRRPVEVTTDQAASYPRILDELLPAAHHVDARRANNRIESDHSQLKARLRPMRGRKRVRSAQTVSSGHANVAEHPPRPLRTRRRHRTAPAGVGCLRRAHPGCLINIQAGSAMSCFPITQQTHHAFPRAALPITSAA